MWIAHGTLKGVLVAAWCYSSAHGILGTPTSWGPGAASTSWVSVTSTWTPTPTGVPPRAGPVQIGILEDRGFQGIFGSLVVVLVMLMM